ncbi:MAG TPA: hypothetical protein IAC31_09030 [Candidatus Faecousia intestinigallinarum]|nr:hypothetical protein [Candidatus Faecousia intestinigallinarum]
MEKVTLTPAYARLYADDYLQEFGKDQYGEMQIAQAQLDAHTDWRTVSSTMAVLPIDSHLHAELLLSRPENTIPRELLHDTADHAGLILQYQGEESCLRACALPSLLNTIGVSGPVFSRLTKEQLAVALSALLTGARKTSKIMLRAGKASAVLSSQYEYMPITGLLQICGSLEEKFGKSNFLGGNISHSLTMAKFEYPQATKAVTDTYNNILASFGKPLSSSLTPVVEFRSSDTSGDAAKLITFLSRDGMLIPLGGFNVIHIPPQDYHSDGTRKTCMERFQEETALLFSRTIFDIEQNLPAMLATSIHYPGNTFVGLCKYANIPQKWGGIIEEEVRAAYPDGDPCSFLDIYEALVSVTTEARNAGISPCSLRMMELEEGICKILAKHSCWKQYDLPGTVAWSTVSSRAKAVRG